MESDQIVEGKKRSLSYLQAQELAHKIKSKVDILDYLDKHRKYQRQPFLTPLQYSSTCRRPTPSTKIS